MPITIPDGSAVFIDANIFVYHFSGPTEFTNLAIMRRHHLTRIATNDPDFERISDLMVWKPL